MAWHNFLAMFFEDGPSSSGKQCLSDYLFTVGNLVGMIPQAAYGGTPPCFLSLGQLKESVGRNSFAYSSGEEAYL